MKYCTYIVALLPLFGDYTLPTPGLTGGTKHICMQHVNKSVLKHFQTRPAEEELRSLWKRDAVPSRISLVAANGLSHPAHPD
jgi:hypothetical protein